MKPFGIDDAKIFPITDEGDICAGGVTAPTYGAGVDVGCVQEFSWGEERTQSELNGDDGKCATVDRMKNGTWTIKHGGLDPALLETLLGMTGTDINIAGPPAVTGRRTVRTFADQGLRFGMIVRSVDESEEKDVHILIWNCRATAGPDGTLSFEQFYESTFAGEADKDLNTCVRDSEAYRIIEHDSLVEIPAAWPGDTDF